MRKLLALLICLMLVPLLPAAAESASGALFRLTLVDGSGGETQLGSAVLALDAQLLFTGAVIDDPAQVRAYAPDGSVHALQYAIDGDSGITLLVLDEETRLPVPDLSMTEPARSRLVGLTRNGLTYDKPAASVSKAVYGGRDASLVSAKERLLPGAVLMDSAGNLVGITVADWGEGEARYVALTGYALIDALMAALIAEPEQTGDSRVDGRTSWLMDAALRYEDGALTVDWSGCEIEGLNDQSEITVYVECPVNHYYVYYTAPASDAMMAVDVVPGYEYNIWVNHAYGTQDEDRMAQYAQNVRIPEAGAFTDYGFTDVCYLAWAPADETPDASEKLPALEPVTAETLGDSDRRLFLQVTNTYAVEEELETSLVIVLQTPEGYVFHQLNGYIFMPEIQTEDVWNADVTQLFMRYLRYNDTLSFAPGEYALSYLIGGQWAGRFTFTLE